MLSPFQENSYASYEYSWISYIRVRKKQISVTAKGALTSWKEIAWTRPLISMIQYPVCPDSRNVIDTGRGFSFRELRAADDYRRCIEQWPLANGCRF